MSAILDAYRAACATLNAAASGAAHVAALRRLGALWSMLSVAERIAVDATIALWPEHQDFLEKTRKETR